MKENKLSRDYNVFYYPKRLIEDKLSHLLSVIELNKGDKAVSDALQEEMSQHRKAISLLTPTPLKKWEKFIEKWWKKLGTVTGKDLKQMLKEYDELKEGMMKWKIVEWYSENLLQRLQTSWTFLRACFRMLIKGRVKIRVKFMNL